MILNEDLRFGDVDDADVRRAFVGGDAVHTKLAIGHQLYKFTEHSLVYRGKVTPWWSSVLPINSSDTGLAVLLERAKRLGVNPNYFSRVRNAVTEEWNSMDRLLRVTLRVPVYGFVGPTADQKVNKKKTSRNVVWIGGATQLWIPNLTLQHVKEDK